jgi:hypothetical protein
MHRLLLVCVLSLVLTACSAKGQKQEVTSSEPRPARAEVLRAFKANGKTATICFGPFIGYGLAEEFNRVSPPLPGRN